MNLTIFILVNDIISLSKTTSWECIQKKSGIEEISSDGVLGTLKKTRECLYKIQSHFLEENNPTHTTNSLLQSLSLQLAQSKRERRNLETKLKIYSEVDQ